MTDDLVKELSRAIFDMRAHVVWPSVDVACKVEVQINKALTAIQRERDKTRDEVLEEVARWVKGRYSHEIGEAIRALKSAPTPKIEYTGWACGRCGGPVAGPSSTCEKCGFSPKAGRRDVKEAAPFTRADGTTSPVRSGVADRRESADGRVINAPGWQERRNGAERYGRRAGDRERWEKATTPQPEQPSLVADPTELRNNLVGTIDRLFKDHQAVTGYDLKIAAVETQSYITRRLAALEKK